MSIFNGCSGQTHIGKVRKENEDRYLVNYWRDQPAVLAVVADGMGSYGGGAAAAATVVETFAELVLHDLPPARAERYELLLAAFYRADERIRVQQKSMRPEMGATVVAAIITPGELLYLHAGDCRIFHFNQDQLDYTSRDHSVVQALIDAGMIDSGQALAHPMRNIVTSCLGGPETNIRLTIDPQYDSTTPESGPGPFRILNSGDTVVMCTDGFWSEVSTSAMWDAVQRAKSSNQVAECLSSALLALALSGKAPDNITGIVIDIDSMRADFKSVGFRIH